MRVGVNPEKLKNDINHRYLHRVIIPVYIPNEDESFYIESLKTFSVCLESLVNSINHETTAITIINNDSFYKVDKIINSFKGQIDKYVINTNNKGKINAVIQEVRGVYEPLVTVSDADVLFYNGWEKEVITIFRKFPEAGVVSPLPCPSLAFYHNSTLFWDTYFKNLNYEEVVDNEDIELYLNGLGNSSLFKRKGHKYDWSEKQYVLSKNSTNAIVGAGHFIATYKSLLFKNRNEFPLNVFEKGDEANFIDLLADIHGLYRLSTTKTYAYHLGNKMDVNVLESRNKKFGLKVEREAFYEIKFKPALRIIPYKTRKFFFKILNRIVKL